MGNKPPEYKSRELMMDAIVNNNLQALKVAMQRASSEVHGRKNVMGQEQSKQSNSQVLLKYLGGELPDIKKAPGCKGLTPVEYTLQLVERGDCHKVLVKALEDEVERHKRRLDYRKQEKGKKIGEPAGWQMTAHERLIERQIARVRADKEAGRISEAEASKKIGDYLAKKHARKGR